MAVSTLPTTLSGMETSIDKDNDHSQNPQEKGVSLTDIASHQIQAMLAKEEDGDKKGLRVFIEKGGCSGMKYSMTFDIFRENDFIAENNGMKVFVDLISLDYLDGSVIDFSEELTGGGFKITNPNARQSCGCGKSFEV